MLHLPTQTCFSIGEFFTYHGSDYGYNSHRSNSLRKTLEENKTLNFRLARDQIVQLEQQFATEGRAKLSLFKKWDM